jgi:hypothetical protein
MKTIDLSSSLEGHVVLWCKGWYGNGRSDAFQRWNEVVTEWSGMPEGHQMHVKDMLALVARTAEAVGCQTRFVMENYARIVAEANDKLTSYHISIHSAAQVWDLVEAYSMEIASADVIGLSQTVKLPKLLPGVVKRHCLKERE